MLMQRARGGIILARESARVMKPDASVFFSSVPASYILYGLSYPDSAYQPCLCSAAGQVHDLISLAVNLSAVSHQTRLRGDLYAPVIATVITPVPDTATISELLERA